MSKKMYKTTIKLEIVTHGKPKPIVSKKYIDLMQSPGALAYLLDHESDLIGPYITGMTFGKSTPIKKKLSHD